jgi:hypothetical protein
MARPQCDTPLVRSDIMNNLVAHKDSSVKRSPNSNHFSYENYTYILHSMLASIPLCPPVRWNDFSKCLYRGRSCFYQGDASALGTHCRAPGSTHNTSVAQGAWE